MGNGGVPERSNGAVLKTADRRKAVRGFKSHPRRLLRPILGASRWAAPRFRVAGGQVSRKRVKEMISSMGRRGPDLTTAARLLWVAVAVIVVVWLVLLSVGAATT